MKNRSLSRTLSVLVPYLWPVGRNDLRIRVMLALICLGLAKAANVYVPLLLGQTVDDLAVIGKSSMTALGIPIAVILAYGFARWSATAFSEVRDALFSRVSQNATRQVALKVFQHLHTLALRFHLDRKTGALNRFIDRGTKGIQFLLSFVVFNLLPTLIEILLVCGILWYKFGIQYALVTGITIALFIWLTFSITAWRIKIRRQMNEADNEASTRSVDSLLNFETVKYFNNEAHESNRINHALRAYESSATKSRESLAFLNIAQVATVTIGIVIMLIMAAVDIRDAHITIGDFVVINAYLLQLSLPLNFLGTIYREIQQSLVDMENMFSLLDEVPEIQDAPDATNIHISNGSIQFKDVSFSYNDNQALLSSVDFSVKPAQTVAIVGPTGSGKSTISRLLFRFYDVTAGIIQVDGQDISQVTQHSLRKSIGMVPQDTVLFNETIEYNIRYARPDASDEQIYEAARKARIHDFIMALPDKYATRVGERGLKLSGGEKQRVAIARAILKDPIILFFDEATSALDSKTESEIQENLKEISKNRTTIMIAHRLSTIVHADQILVLQNGTIHERGTHQDLLSLKSLYAQMWEEQKRARNKTA
ncbi:MAG: metal ABC transporter permease [Acidiferrobacteraceae bacterium]|nr:metal ABC transporter permease [Acidiferrobacteraceae bacterium]